MGIWSSENTKNLKFISQTYSLYIQLGLCWKHKKHAYLTYKYIILTIYKSYVRPHLDYADVIYDQPQNKVFSNKIESVQYNAALAITGAIKDTSRKNTSRN